MKMTITGITCKATVSTVESTDNLFLLIQADAGPPARFPLTGSVDMKVGSEMTLPDGGYAVNFDYGVVVTGYDLDSLLLKNLDSPDFLFNLSVNTTSRSGTQTLTFCKNQGEGTSEYVVSYEISSS